jgi:hypothetical protein
VTAERQPSRIFGLRRAGHQPPAALVRGVRIASVTPLRPYIWEDHKRQEPPPPFVANIRGQHLYNLGKQLSEGDTVAIWPVSVGSREALQ